MSFLLTQLLLNRGHNSRFLLFASSLRYTNKLRAKRFEIFMREIHKKRCPQLTQFFHRNSIIFSRFLRFFLQVFPCLSLLFLPCPGAHHLLPCHKMRPKRGPIATCVVLTPSGIPDPLPFFFVFSFIFTPKFRPEIKVTWPED